MSAFEFYQKQKKKSLKRLKITGNENKLTSSTPLPQNTVFTGITPVPSSYNEFLCSPISKVEDKLTKKAKKRLRIESNYSEQDSLNSDEKHKKKIKKLTVNESENKFIIDDVNNADDWDVVNSPVIKKKDRPKHTAKLSNGQERIGNEGNESVVKKKKNRRHTSNLKDGNNPTENNQDSEDVFVHKKIKPSLNLTSNYLTNAPNLDNGSHPKAEDAELHTAMASKKNKNKIEEPTVNSMERGKNMLAWILSPVTVEDFFANYWEKKPLYISRKNKEYFNGVCSKEDLDQAFKRSPVYLLKNVTVTAYKDGVRTTDSTPGRARPTAVWDMYNNGHSIRVLNPQTFVPNVGTMVATLQEYFRNMVGVNSYLTPAGSQGFAPHYDDIEAFVIQMEGEKDWKVYPPRSEGETLPKFSSPDFEESELGPPCLETTVQAGDLLYFPRGWIHQARSVEGQHSLHLTVSTYQCNSWGDYFKQVLPSALENAIANDVALRQGLPLDFLDHMGVESSNSNTQARSEIQQKAITLFSKIIDHCAWDEAADQLGKEFIHSSFPPQHEELSEYAWMQMLENPAKTKISLVAANVCRICSLEDDRLICYYSTDNSLEPKGEDLLGFEITHEEAGIIQRLRSTYPTFQKCRRFICDEFNEENLADLLAALAQRGIISVKFLKKSSSSR